MSAAEPIDADEFAPPSAATLAELQGLAHALEPLLPAQAPIRDFVHHNTLHGFQHLPFHEALAAARELTGASAWLPEATSRALYAAGRIDAGDLEAALDALLPAADELASGLSARAVELAALRYPVAPLTPEQLAWEIDERAALRGFQATVPAAMRARLRAGEAEADALGALWSACGELLPTPEPCAEDPEAAATALIDALWQRLGHSWTWRELLLALTGEDLLETLRPTLVRELAAHLDLGLAPWPHPRRGQGLFAAWKASAGLDPERSLEDGTELRTLALTLPEAPLAAIVHLCQRSRLPEERWPGYLTRLALQLPGWAGMVLWRGARPDYPDAPKVPVALLDFLAIHLALESLAAARIVQRHWRLAANFELLEWHFRHQPAEALVRHARFSGELDESDSDLARQILLNSRAPEHEQLPRWQALARRLLASRARRAAEAHAGGRRWPLFVLAQHLGLSAATLRGLGAAGAQALLARLERLDADTRGHLWLLAYERHYRQQVLAALAANRTRAADPPPPTAQLLFCMDDREEGIRRHLEELSPDVETLGAAGFFGVAMHWTGLDERAGSNLCPVVVTPAHALREVADGGEETALGIRRRQLARRRRWQSILYQRSRLGSPAATLTTSLAAPLTLAALAAKVLAPRALGRWRRRLGERFLQPVRTRPAVTATAPGAGFTDAEQAERVFAMLRTIGLVDRFAPLVVIVGHGSHSQNNPHASAYDCGACSGRHGGPNARVFAAMANRAEVRARLAERGLAIPATTFFLAAEHDTCDDTFHWFDADLLPPALTEAFAALERALAEAGRRHAHERCRRFASAPAWLSPATASRHVAGRGDDFAQARPELGHVTNAAALIGRRTMSRGIFLDRRSFLISYDPSLDADGSILEKLLLAAGPVGAGISLEYYFSTVNNERYGCSTKVMHNLAGLIGVMEGAASDLRTGLPVQMIEIHEAMRLLIVCEAKPTTLSQILDRQPALQELVGKAWVQLVAQDPDSGAQHHFMAGSWRACPAPAAAPPTVRHSAAWYAGERGALPPALLGGEA